MANRINVDVKKWETIKPGKFKIKIVQTNVNLSSLTHKGEQYTVTKNLGRGRYIVKVEGPNL